MVQALMGLLVGVYESINIDIGYDYQDTSPDNLFSYTVFTDDSKLKGTFDSVFSQAHLFMQVFILMAYVIVLTIFIYKLYTAMFQPDSRDAENIWKMAGKLLVSIFLITWSYSIFVYVEKIAQVLYEQVFDVYLTAAGSAKESFLSNFLSIQLGAGTTMIRLDGIKDILAYSTGISGIVTMILFIGFFIAIIWQYCRLLLEIIERYVLLGVMFYTCPLAFSATVSDSTKHIFRSWCQMLFTQFLLMMMNLFFIGTFVAALDNVYCMEGKEYVFASLGDFVIKNFMLIAWLTIGQRLDQYLNAMGFSVMQAGSNLGSALVTTAAASYAAAKTFGTVLGVTKDFGKALYAAGKGLSTDMQAAKAGKDSAVSAITAAGSAVNTAKVENLSGRDVNTGKLTKEGVQEAMQVGATLTGEDAKSAAEAMNLPQAGNKESADIDWNNSQINREGATFMSKSDPGVVSSHVAFGNEWVAKDQDGNPLAQMAVPTTKGFADGTRVMTDHDLSCANAEVLDQLTNPASGMPNATWTTPEGNPIQDASGNYTKDALGSSYFVGTDTSDPSQQYVAGLNNVNSFDIDQGGRVNSRSTTAHGDVPSFEYSVQHVDKGCTPTVASSKPVLDTSATSTYRQSDVVLQKKDPVPMPVEPKEMRKQTIENFKAIRSRKKKHH